MKNYHYILFKIAVGIFFVYLVSQRPNNYASDALKSSFWLKVAKKEYKGRGAVYFGQNEQGKNSCIDLSYDAYQTLVFPLILEGDTFIKEEGSHYYKICRKDTFFTVEAKNTYSN